MLPQTDGRTNRQHLELQVCFADKKDQSSYNDENDDDNDVEVTSGSVVRPPVLSSLRGGRVEVVVEGSVVVELR